MLRLHAGTLPGRQGFDRRTSCAEEPCKSDHNKSCSGRQPPVVCRSAGGLALPLQTCSSLVIWNAHLQDKDAVLLDVRSIISEQLGTELDKVILACCSLLLVLPPKCACARGDALISGLVFLTCNVLRSGCRRRKVCGPRRRFARHRMPRLSSCRPTCALHVVYSDRKRMVTIERPGAESVEPGLWQVEIMMALEEKFDIQLDEEGAHACEGCFPFLKGADKAAP